MKMRSRAPLRIGLAGGGTDLSPYCELHGGAVLNVTIDLYAYATLDMGNNSAVVEFKAADTGQVMSLAPDDMMTIKDGPLPLHRAVYRRIVNQFAAGRPFPCSIITYCEAPPGSGLGSSSTLVVAMLKAFVEALMLPLGEYDIAHLAFEIERIDAGMHGGRQDQYAATFGGFNFIEFYADDRVIVNPLRIKNWILAELESSLVMYHTGVSRASADIIDEQTQNLTSSTGGAVEATHRLKEDAYAMKEAVLKGDISRIAETMNRSWISKRKTASRVSSEKIERSMELAFQSGAVAGKVSGAGGGGFITFLVEPTRRMEVIKALHGTDGEVVTCSFTKRGTEGWRIE